MPGAHSTAAGAHLIGSQAMVTSLDGVLLIEGGLFNRLYPKIAVAKPRPCALCGQSRYHLRIPPRSIAVSPALPRIPPRSIAVSLAHPTTFRRSTSVQCEPVAGEREHAGRLNPKSPAFCTALWMRGEARGKAARGSGLNAHDRATPPRRTCIRAAAQCKIRGFCRRLPCAGRAPRP